MEKCLEINTLIGMFIQRSKVLGIDTRECFKLCSVVGLGITDKISNFPELQGCGSKNEPAMPISNLNLLFSKIS